MTTTDNWQVRHANAVINPQNGHEEALVSLLDATRTYVKAHNKQSEYRVGDDGYIGPAVESILQGIRQLFGGERGRLDGGSLDRYLLLIAEEAGIEESKL